MNLLRLPSRVRLRRGLVARLRFPSRVVRHEFASLACIAILISTPWLQTHVVSRARSAAVAGPGWAVRAIGLTSLSHDTVCRQYSQTDIDRFVGYATQFNANFATVSVPFDDASGFDCSVRPLTPYGYMKAWADSIHAAGLHVLYRGNWNHWAGTYGQAKLSYGTSPAIAYESAGGLRAVIDGTDTTSYVGLTYQWILHHAEIFWDGDVFEPFGEPQNVGITHGPRGTSAAHCPKSVCQFPSTAAFNQWLSDFGQAEQRAFSHINRNVETGWFGLAGDSYTYVTAAALAHSNTYNVDHFTIDFAGFTSRLQASWQAFHKPIVVEWGDTQEAGTQPATTITTERILGWLARQPYIKGVEYWQLSGNDPSAPERAINLTDGTLTATGQVVSKWFGIMDVSRAGRRNSHAPFPFAQRSRTGAH